MTKEILLKEYESMLLIGSYYWISKEELEDRISKLKIEIRNQNNMKKSSIEWLIDKFGLTSDSPTCQNIIEQAKEMHKRETIDFAQKWEDSMLYEYDSKECLYNETFKNK